MKFAIPFLALVCLAIANGQANTSESDEVKEHLILTLVDQFRST